MRKPDTEAVSTPEDVVSLMGTDEVNRLGEAARERARLLTGDTVYYGSLTPPGKVTTGGYDEVRLSDREDVESTAVDAFVGTPENTTDDYRGASAPVDIAVTYGDDAEGFAEGLAEVREVSADTEVRAVTLVPDGRTTAFTDLKAVAVARLYLDVLGVRVARDEVGDKLAQTALAYGANDLGFVGENDDFDPELTAREAGFTPVDRADVGGYGV
jgi:hypothetical protein